MVAKGDVLLGVQHLKHSRRWVAAEIVAHLINLIEQNERIRRACTAQRIDNAAGHCPNIGLAVSADIRFVPHAAQAHACISTPHRLGDRFCNRCLAHARRPHQAQNLSLKTGSKRFYSQELHNTFLDLFQAVVVAVENGLCFRQVKPLLAFFVPRQFEHCIQISAHHALFGV